MYHNKIKYRVQVIMSVYQNLWNFEAGQASNVAESVDNVGCHVQPLQIDPRVISEPRQFDLDEHNHPRGAHPRYSGLRHYHLH